MLIDRAEAAYLQYALLSPNSPMLDLWLQAPREKNRQVSEETWRAVREQLAAALTKVLGQRGGVMDSVLRQSMSSLSDSDLQRIVEILNDPAYARFQQAVASPESQKQLLQTIIGSALAMQGALNEILRQHGLNEVH